MTTRILIVGAGGTLGTELARRFREPSLSLDPAFPGPFEVTALSHRELDVARLHDVDRAVDRVRPQILFNAAGLTDLDLCEQHKWQAYLVNRDGAEHLARAAQRHEALVVYFGTDLVFDGGQRFPYSEEDPPNPTNLYGDTKLAGELATMTHSKRFLIVRGGPLFGASGRNPAVTLLEESARESFVLGYDDQERQPTFVSDFVSAVFHLIAKENTGLFHAANSGGVNDVAFARMLLSLAGRASVPVREIQHGMMGRGPLVPRYSVLECRKLESTGMRMHSWEEGLRAFVAESGLLR